MGIIIFLSIFGTFAVTTLLAIATISALRFRHKINQATKAASAEVRTASYESQQ